MRDAIWCNCWEKNLQFKCTGRKKSIAACCAAMRVARTKKKSMYQMTETLIYLFHFHIFLCKEMLENKMAWIWNDMEAHDYKKMESIDRWSDSEKNLNILNRLTVKENTLQRGNKLQIYCVWPLPFIPRAARNFCLWPTLAARAGTWERNWSASGGLHQRIWGSNALKSLKLMQNNANGQMWTDLTRAVNA